MRRREGVAEGPAGRAGDGTGAEEVGPGASASRRRRRLRRLVLFDVDGTLVRGGPAKDAFQVALVETFGTAGSIENHEFSGKTDPQIARELLNAAGWPDPDIDALLPSLWGRYLEEMERRLPERPMELLPGVRRLLDALEGLDQVGLGLLTGNIAPGARLKLGSVGLSERFPVGGFGSDDEIRNRLPAVALKRARKHWGVEFPADAVVVVGDTPRDVACGRAGGHRTVAVATGRIPRRVLEGTAPHHLFDDLTGTEAVVEAILA